MEQSEPADANAETLLGACRVDWDLATGVGHFGMLGVPPRHAGRGIGRAIVRAVKQFLKTSKAQTSISMPVVYSRNERLVRWYERLGFTQVGDLFQFPVPDIVRAEYAGMILMQQMQCSLTEEEEEEKSGNPSITSKSSASLTAAAATRPPPPRAPSSSSSCSSSSSSSSSSPAAPFTFTLCTYNLWKSKGKPACWDVRRPVLLRQLRRLDPDVLLVQELCPGIASCVLEALPQHRCVAPYEGSPDGWKEEGQIFFRASMFTEVDAGAEDIEQEEPLRRLFWTRLQFRRQAVSAPQPSAAHGSTSTALFATAHFTWQGHPRECETDLNLRKKQARNTAVALELLGLRNPDEPQFFGGDLNESFWPKRILETSGFADCFTPLGLPCRATHPNRSSLAHEEVNADSALDWLFARGTGVKPLLATVVRGGCGLSSDDPDERSKLSVVPSDHCPVMAVYRIE